MAKLERTLQGNFDDILNALEQAVLGSVSATREDATSWSDAGARCELRVYERYSMIGSNRVSLSLMLFGFGDTVRVSAITSGGSQAVFFKMNTIGEQAFLQCVQNALDRM